MNEVVKIFIFYLREIDDNQWISQRVLGNNRYIKKIEQGNVLKNSFIVWVEVYFRWQSVFIGYTKVKVLFFKFY